MKTIPLRKILRALAATQGLAFTGSATTSQVTAEQRFQLIELVNEALRDAWQLIPWWQTSRLEQRQFRKSWSSIVSYDYQEEVYYDVDGKYYRTIDSPILAFPPTDTLYWEEVTNLDCYILLEPDENFPNATEIGTLVDVFDADPRLSASSRGSRLIYELRNDRVQFRPDIATPLVWLDFQAAAPVLDGDDYDAAETVPIGTVRYYHATGECYRAIAETSALPTDTDDWTPVLIPQHLAAIIRESARAHYLRANGDEEKAAAAEALAERARENEILRNTDRKSVV